MSCRYDAHCLDCDADAGLYDTNRMPELVSALVEHAKALGALAPLAERIGREGYDCALELTSITRVSDYAWFAEHAGHRLVVRNEYGEVWTDKRAKGGG